MNEPTFEQFAGPLEPDAPKCEHPLEQLERLPITFNDEHAQQGEFPCRCSCGEYLYVPFAAFEED